MIQRAHLKKESKSDNVEGESFHPYMKILIILHPLFAAYVFVLRFKSIFVFPLFRLQYASWKQECKQMFPVIGSGGFITAPVITEKGQPILDPLVLQETNLGKTKCVSLCLRK